jgi:hypothetical protein
MKAYQYQMVSSIHNPPLHKHKKTRKKIKTLQQPIIKYTKTTTTHYQKHHKTNENQNFTTTQINITAKTHFENVITSNNFGSATNCVGFKVPLACFRLGDDASWSGFSHGTLRLQVSSLLDTDEEGFW